MSEAKSPTKPRGEDGSIALVIGANRGIGLALADRLSQSPDFARVIATHQPNRMSPQLSDLVERSGRTQALTVDVTDTKSIEGLAEHIEAQQGKLELVVHAAGILHDGDLQPEKALEQCEPEHLLHLFSVNSIGPLMTARALIPNIPKRQRFTFAAISAMVGSIGDNRRGGWYGYRASKAALNQLMRTLALECRRRLPRACVVSIHPGTTDTQLSKPFQRNIDDDKLYSPDQSAARILSVLDNLRPEHTGRFYNWNGEEIPW